MKNFFPLFLTFAVSITFFFTSPTAVTAEEDFQKPEELVLQSEAVLKSFMADPNMQWLHKQLERAQGIFIVPQMLRAGFIVGGSGGSGLLMTRNQQTGTWSQPAFYTMGSVSFGLQIGAEASEIILLVMTDKGIDAMLSNEFKLGGDISVAAGPLGGLAKAQTADVFAYGRSKGAYGGMSVEGAVIAPRHKWNSTYYNQEVRPLDILIKNSVHNPQADNLVGAITNIQTTKQTTKPLGQ